MSRFQLIPPPVGPPPQCFWGEPFLDGNGNWHCPSDPDGPIDPRLREAIFNNQPDELAGIWDAVGQWGSAAINNFLPAIMGAGGASGSGQQARGLAAINAYGQQVIQALNQILAAVQQTISQTGQFPQQALTDAQSLAATLSNSTYVYQARSGNDATALAQFKTQAAAIVGQIQSFASSAPTGQPQTGGQTTTQTVINPATGQPQTIIGPARSNGSGGSISPNVLMLGGAALLLVLLLKK